MQMILDVLKYVAAHYQEMISAVVAVLAALIAFFMLIPGSAPESQLQSVLDFIKKFSAK